MSKVSFEQFSLMTRLERRLYVVARVKELMCEFNCKKYVAVKMIANETNYSPLTIDSYLYYYPSQKRIFTLSDIEQLQKALKEKCFDYPENKIHNDIYNIIDKVFCKFKGLR